MIRFLLGKLTGLALVLMSCGPALAMGGSTPPPDSIAVERAAPARPGATPRDDGAAAPAAPQPPAAEQLDIRAATDITPEALLFERRPVVVFADTPADAAFATQMELLQRDPATLARRGVTVITDTDPAAQSPWRQKLRPRGFSLMVLDLDGTVIDRKPSPWDSREIGRAIDKTPVRRSESRAHGGR